MNKFTLASLSLVTATVLVNGANASEWRDRIASERGYSDHSAMEDSYEKAREEQREHQQREDDRRAQADADDQRERARSCPDD